MKDKMLLIPGTRSILIIGIILFFFSSCVPNKKIAYLQYGDELSKRSGIPIDSIVRLYETSTYHYKLQPDDQVEIKISTTTPDEFNPFSLADRYMTTTSSVGESQASSTGYYIDPYGYLNLPIIGRLKAAGLNLFELQDTITSLAAADLENPVTKVNLMNFRFTLMGEVSSEGTRQTSDHTLTLMQAMSMGGGPSEFGDISRVKVVRRINEQNYVFYVNLLDESFLSSEFYYVHPNDVIVVTPMKNRLLVQNLPQSIALLTSTLSLILTVITLATLINSN
jgi:polysaccharide export outer membrane protein